MDRFSVYVPKLLPKAEHFISGRRSCKGCGKSLAARIATKAVPEAVFPERTIDASPGFALSGHGYSHDPLTLDAMVEKLLGDVGTYDSDSSKASHTRHKPLKKPVIALSRTVFEDDFLALQNVADTSGDVLYLCFDNEPYMDNLVRRTAPQPFYENLPHSAVTPADIDGIIQQKNRPEAFTNKTFSYLATATPAYHLDYVTKIKKALTCRGSSLILVLTPCPTGWIFPSRLSVKVGTAAVKTGYFPLYEHTGASCRITEKVAKRRPLPEYLAMQRRFLTLPPQVIQLMQASVDRYYDALTHSQG